MYSALRVRIGIVRRAYKRYAHFLVVISVTVFRIGEKRRAVIAVVGAYIRKGGYIVGELISFDRAVGNIGAENAAVVVADGNGERKLRHLLSAHRRLAPVDARDEFKRRAVLFEKHRTFEARRAEAHFISHTAGKRRSVEIRISHAAFGVEIAHAHIRTDAPARHAVDRVFVDIFEITRRSVDQLFPRLFVYKTCQTRGLFVEHRADQVVFKHERSVVYMLIHVFVHLRARILVTVPFGLFQDKRRITERGYVGFYEQRGI